MTARPDTKSVSKIINGQSIHPFKPTETLMFTLGYFCFIIVQNKHFNRYIY
ncbi:hypothetical protein GCM10011412_34930 [Maribacter cobaltidurans]|nr:hypothetical protein GCM10011412_34930 [Maribacter cobaltidurans]